MYVVSEVVTGLLSNLAPLLHIGWSLVDPVNAFTSKVIKIGIGELSLPVIDTVLIHNDYGSVFIRWLGGDVIIILDSLKSLVPLDTKDFFRFGLMIYVVMKTNLYKG